VDEALSSASEFKLAHLVRLGKYLKPFLKPLIFTLVCTVSSTIL
jgi:hypothetical protein